MQDNIFASHTFFGAHIDVNKARTTGLESLEKPFKAKFNALKSLNFTK